MLARLSSWARSIKQETLALYFAARDARTPWHARMLAGLVVAYALSPIDLIPDFIPVLGYVDDLVLVPLGIWVAIKLIPAPIMDEHRARAATLSDRPVSKTAAAAIVTIWIGAAAFLAWWTYSALRR